ncbi:MAG TPA: hypothetical protein VEY95_10115 [Azospirillaceae bacterium]|nr:hypothetical protein [Azospirillaceae bacterium]
MFDFSDALATGGRVGQAHAKWPLQGDSGAWVCHRKRDGTLGYFGNLVAVTGGIGIATFAQDLREWALGLLSLELDVF